MNDELKNSIFVGIVFGLIFGVIICAYLDSFGLFTFAAPISGIGFGLLMYLFATSKNIQTQMQIQDSEMSSVIFSTGANHFKGLEAVGGKLYLLPDRLHFKSHNFNAQNHELVIPLSDIQNIDFFNPFIIVPKGLSVELKNGTVEKFVVNRRSVLKSKIQNIIVLG